VSYQTGRNYVGESQNTLDILSRRFLPGRGWIYQAVCRSCQRDQTFPHSTLASSGATCRYCATAQPKTESLADAVRRERLEAEQVEAERRRMSAAEKRAFDQKVAEQRAFRRIQKQYIAVYNYHRKYGSQQRFLEEMPLSQWIASSELWRADYAQRCGIPEQD
jgi:hypothetical protein